MCLGIPGRIVAISDGAAFLAIVDVAGVRREVNIACVVDKGHPPESCIGEWVLVHVGFAMSRIDENEARKTLELLVQLGEMDDELAVLKGASEVAD